MASDIIVIERELLKSKAFRSLSGTAKNVYFDFRMKCKVKNRKIKSTRKHERIILNNGEIEYCYSEAEKKGIQRSTFMNCLDAIIENGFIDVTHSGSGGKKGDKSLYAISERWRAWKTDDFIKAFRPKDNRNGRGFRSGNDHWKRKKFKHGCAKL